MKIREMEYVPERTTEILAKGTINYYNYFVISYGTHPCCYVELPAGHKLYGLTYIDIEENYQIDVHGGFTYSCDSLLLKDNTWILGWDYAHLGDYYCANYSSDISKSHRWTTVEMIKECIEVIKQLEKINKEVNNNENNENN